MKKIILSVILILSLTGCSGFQRFDAQEYVQAILDQTFQGDVTGALRVIPGATREELVQQYEQGIAMFVLNNIVSGMPVNEEEITDYIALCKAIFSAMRYQVKEAERISRTEYQVEVVIHPVDVFVNFVAELVKVSEEIRERVEDGEYAGSDEEINLQMQEEFVERSYELLVQAAIDITYGEAVTLTLGVRADEDNVFTVVTEDLSNMIIKILRLDEIQG